MLLAATKAAVGAIDCRRHCNLSKTGDRRFTHCRTLLDVLA